jgi:hypothetical protein
LFGHSTGRRRALEERRWPTVINRGHAREFNVDIGEQETRDSKQQKETKRDSEDRKRD